MKYFLLSLTLILSTTIVLFGQQTTPFFKIGCYGSPPADERSFFHFKDANFNTALAVNPGLYNPWMPCSDSKEDINKYRMEILELAAEKDIDIMLDQSFFALKHDSYLIKRYSGLNAFKGFILPTVQGNKQAKSWSIAQSMGSLKGMQRRYKNKLGYASLLPSYASSNEIGNFGKTNKEENYQAYLQLVLSKMSLDAVGLGHYPMTKGEGKKGSFANYLDKEPFLNNLALLAPIARETQTTWWSYIMTAAHKDKQYAPTISMVNMMVNASLSYGAKGIFYYRYYKSCKGEHLDSEYYGPFMLDVRQTNPKYWNQIKDLNKNLSYLGPHMMKAQWVRTERLKANEEEQTICMDSCTLVDVTDTTRKTVHLTSEVVDFVIEEFDNCQIQAIDTSQVDSVSLDSLGLSIPNLTTVNNTTVDSLNTQDSITSPLLFTVYSYHLLCTKTTAIDVSKNIQLKASGKDIDLLLGVFDYGSNHKLLSVTNYQYEADKQVEISVDFSNYYEVLDLDYKSKRFRKPTQKSNFTIPAGDCKIFVLKKK